MKTVFGAEFGASALKVALHQVTSMYLRLVAFVFLVVMGSWLADADAAENTPHSFSRVAIARKRTGCIISVACC